MLTVAREVAERYNLTEVESDRHRLHHSVLEMGPNNSETKYLSVSILKLRESDFVF